ncbi:MAG TPA: hypothetical protein VEO00_04330 [Actinomycetota bacterium]|nr:hypothetical protein [Actinomycetota bacterium]
MSGRLVIRIPPATAYAGLVRAAASALAARLDFTYDQIMDLHIAVDEICSRLLATTAAPTALEVVLEARDGALVVHARAEGSARPDRPFLNEWSERILRSVVDRFTVEQRDGSTTVRLDVARAGR